MKRICVFIAAIATSLPLLGADAVVQYLVTSHGPNAITIVDAAGVIKWQHKGVKHPQDAALTQDGKVFCSEITGASMIRRDHSLQWRYSVPKGCQNPVAQVLGRARFLVGNEGPGKLLEIDSSGNVLKEIQLSPKSKKSHGQFRFCRKTVQGTYLVPETNDGRVREYRTDGSVVRDFGAFRTPVAAIRLANGNTLIGSFRRVDEFDSAGKLVWTFNPVVDGGLADVSKKQGHVTGLAKLRNGNIAFAFYHTVRTWPDIVECNSGKKIIRRITLRGIDKVAALQPIYDQEEE